MEALAIRGGKDREVRGRELEVFLRELDGRQLFHAVVPLQ
jgi:hypothetical protein